MADIKVYDRKNTERFLGTLTVRESIRGSIYSVALMPEMPKRSMFDGQIAHDYAATKIDFHLDWSRRTTAESQFSRTIQEEAYLTTDAELKDLMKVDRFCLPDEGSREAFYRRVNSCFY